MRSMTFAQFLPPCLWERIWEKGGKWEMEVGLTENEEWVLQKHPVLLVVMCPSLILNSPKTGS